MRRGVLLLCLVLAVCDGGKAGGAAGSESAAPTQSTQEAEPVTGEPASAASQREAPEPPTAEAEPGPEAEAEAEPEASRPLDPKAGELGDLDGLLDGTREGSNCDRTPAGCDAGVF